MEVKSKPLNSFTTNRLASHRVGCGQGGGKGLMKGELESHYSELILLNMEEMKLIQCMCEWMVTLRTHIDSVRKM